MTQRTPGHGQRGSTTVEFAIVGTLTMLLVLAVFDLGRALYTYHLVANAAREATRYAIVRGSSCTSPGCPASSADIQAYVRGISPGVDPAQLAVTATWQASPATGCPASPYQGPGCLVTVEVDYPYAFMSSLLPNLTLPMRSISQLSISQ